MMWTTLLDTDLLRLQSRMESDSQDASSVSAADLQDAADPTVVGQEREFLVEAEKPIELSYKGGKTTARVKNTLK